MTDLNWRRTGAGVPDAPSRMPDGAHIEQPIPTPKWLRYVLLTAAVLSLAALSPERWLERLFGA